MAARAQDRMWRTLFVMSMPKLASRGRASPFSLMCGIPSSCAAQAGRGRSSTIMSPRPHLPRGSCSCAVLNPEHGRNSRREITMHHNDQAGSRVFVVGICGSLRRGSYTRMAVQMALQGAQEVGAQTRLIDLKDYQLVSCDGKEDESIYPERGIPSVVKLRPECQSTGHALGAVRRISWPKRAGDLPAYGE